MLFIEKIYYSLMFAMMLKKSWGSGKQQRVNIWIAFVASWILKSLAFGEEPECSFEKVVKSFQGI